MASRLLARDGVRAAAAVLCLCAAACGPEHVTGTPIDAPPVRPIDAAPDGPPRQCSQNSDCGSDHVCSPAGMCQVGCGSDRDCAAGESCCGNGCISITDDVHNCGGCGITCGADEACCNSACSTLETNADCGACGSACGSGSFCGGSACTLSASYCLTPTVYEVFDGLGAGDVDATALLTSTFTENCDPTSTNIIATNTTDATIIDQTTGQLVGGADVTYVLSGGAFADKAVAYLENTAATTPVYLKSTSPYAFMARAGSATIASTACGSAAPATDLFTVERLAEGSGAQVLIGYGICTGAGTYSSAVFYTDVVLADPLTYTDTWYVGQWTDANGNGIADGSDSFTVLASGT